MNPGGAERVCFEEAISIEMVRVDEATSGKSKLLRFLLCQAPDSDELPWRSLAFCSKSYRRAAIYNCRLSN